MHIYKNRIIISLEYITSILSFITLPSITSAAIMPVQEVQSTDFLYRVYTPNTPSTSSGNTNTTILNAPSSLSFAIEPFDASTQPLASIQFRFNYVYDFELTSFDSTSASISASGAINANGANITDSSVDLNLSSIQFEPDSRSDLAYFNKDILPSDSSFTEFIGLGEVAIDLTETYDLIITGTGASLDYNFPDSSTLEITYRYAAAPDAKHFASISGFIVLLAAYINMQFRRKRRG